MAPQRYREFIAALKSVVESGKVPMSRIDDAVTRILRAKAAMGLLEPSFSPRADRSLLERFGSAAHRAVTRQAVRESQVLLKNEKATLPLKSTAKRIHVAGSAARDLGIQCGGWTIDWQGKRGELTVGTTILAGIEQHASKADTRDLLDRWHRRDRRRRRGRRRGRGALRGVLRRSARPLVVGRRSRGDSQCQTGRHSGRGVRTTGDSG